MPPPEFTGHFEKLPRTFGAVFHEQIRDWKLLFPAEQDYYQRLMKLLDSMDDPVRAELFAPMLIAEEAMGVNDKNWPRGQFSLEQVDFLNRNAHYAEWRKAVAGVFARIDPLIDAEKARAGRPRFVMVTAPADIPVGPDRMWTRLEARGKRVALGAGALEPLQALPAQYAKARAKSLYDVWTIGATDAPAFPGGVAIGYEPLSAYRTRLMDEISRLVSAEEIRGPRQLGERLKQLKLKTGEGAIASDPVLSEFARSILLAGNGTLLINNTFVEWATVQAVRRARPAVTAISFGIRNKVKPFSGLLIYANQETTTPIPTQVDTLGTYVDLEVFYQYIWQEFEKYVEYRRNTVYLFAAEGMDEAFLIGPPDFAYTAPLTARHIADWLAL